MATPEQPTQPPAATILGVASLAFVLNLVWEYAQLPLYGGDDCCPPTIMLRATTVDMIFITGAAGIGLVVLGAWRRWGGGAGASRARTIGVFLALIVVMLAATAAVIEIRAITAGRWSYSGLMPTIGIVGLSPLLQLPLTGTLACCLARAWRVVAGPGPDRLGTPADGAGLTTQRTGW